MSFELEHTFVVKRVEPKARKSGTGAFFEVDASGQFPVLFPGRIFRGAAARFTHRKRVATPETVGGPAGEPPPGGTEPLHGGFESESKIIPLTLQIFTPDGVEFTGSEVTIADLRRFRDARGAPSGPWSFRLTGRSETIEVDEDSLIVDPKGTMRIGVIERIESASAPPLVASVALGTAAQQFQFDLFRVGTFVAQVSQLLIVATSPWRGTLRLIDPDGIVRAQSVGSKLTFDVTLATLSKSRDGTGAVRRWKLEAIPPTTPSNGRATLSATVIGTGRVRTAALRERIDALLGPRGAHVELFGQDRNNEALLRLRVTDQVSAETLDMHGLLDGVLGTTPQDVAFAGDIQANTVYTLGRLSSQQKFGTTLRIGSLKVTTIDAVFGPGDRLGPTVPTLHLGVAVAGKAVLKLGALTLAEIKVPGGRIDIEVGIALSADGTPQLLTHVPDTLLDADVNATTAAALAITGPLGIVTAAGIEAAVEAEVRSQFNDPVVKGIRETLGNPTLAPSILMMILGAHLSYRPFRIEGEDFVFDHIAPVEPEPKPRAGYQGAIGRSFVQLGPTTVRFTPPVLPDTWKAGNLAKINHVVVVMMENRSYDHVLGYRAARGDGADGLTPEMIAAIESAAPGGFDVRRLAEAGFAKNAQGRMTRLPLSVGHELHDVTQQLGQRITGPEGRTINSPAGFVENFAPRVKLPPGAAPHGVVANDVLGFYDDSDLPFFGFLAEHYAYCDRYFCSHPGPTLPNRMYSLTGDLQYDRYGFPILDNNDGDNFLLSRAPTIYDLMARRGLGFRVYESAPSVTMLRMFARYATDTTNIVPLTRLAADAAAGNLPALTVIEPSLHHHPQNDDHPDADMHRGQVFLQGVYSALRASPLWEKTLLVITYDEHGGLYDHVVPPVAELLPSGRALELKQDTGVSPGGPPPSLVPVPYGVRVPTFVVSPWTMRGKGPAITLDHCSILKTVMARFMGTEKPFLSDRVAVSHSFDAFLTEAAPRLNVPEPPLLEDLPVGVRSGLNSASAIVTPALTRRRMRDGGVDYHDLSGRWARQLGR